MFMSRYCVYLIFAHSLTSARGSPCEYQAQKSTSHSFIFVTFIALLFPLMASREMDKPLLLSAMLASKDEHEVAMMRFFC